MEIFELATRLTTTGEQQVLVVLDRVQKKGEETARKTSDAWKTVGAAIAGALTARAIGQFFATSIAESTAAAQALDRYRVAVRNTGGDLAALEPQAQAAAESLQALTRFDDDAAVDALATLTSITGSAEKALDNLSLVADIASAKQMDLGSAAQLVGRVLTGNTTMLARYGIVVKEGTDAMVQLRQTFDGFAESEGKGPAGQLARTRNALANMQQAIGDVITQSAQWSRLMERIIQVLQNGQRWIEANADTVEAFATVVGRTVEAVINILATAAQGWAFIWGGMQIAVIAVVGYFQSFPARLQMYLGIALGVIADFVQAAATVFDKVFGTDLANGVIATLRRTGTALRTAGAEELQRYEDAFTTTAQAILDQAAGNTPRPGTTKRKGSGTTPTEPVADPQELAAYAKAYEDYLTTLREGVAFEQTRAESVRGLEAAYQRTTRALDATNLSLEEQVALRRRLADISDSLGEARQADRAAESRALTLRNNEAISKLLTDFQADLPLLQAQTEALIAAMGPALSDAAIEAFQEVEDVFRDTPTQLASVLTDSFAAAFTGGLGDAKDIVLQGLGAIFTAMGSALIKYGLAMMKLLPFLTNPFTSGPAALAAGALLVVLGKSLGAAAASSAGGASGGSPASGPSFDGYRGSQQANIVRIVVASPAGAGPQGAADVTPRTPIQIGPFIGPADPVAVRGIADMVNSAQDRGLIRARR